MNPLTQRMHSMEDKNNLFNQATPHLTNTSSNRSLEILVKSEPQVKKRLPLSNKTNTNNTPSSLATKVISADTVEFEAFLDNDARKKESLKSQSEPFNHFKSQNRVKTLSIEQPVFENKKKNEFKISAQLLTRLLKHDTLIEEELGAQCDDPQQLFNFLEQEGKLSHKVLAVFSKSDGIRSVSMTPSYGAPVDNLGLRCSPAFPVEKCTRSFYSGFPDLQILDFTNVPLPDDELRFLIKLSKLQALGLSGTKITCKGIKYLTQHAAFKSTLKCLKLCFADGLDDSVFSLLPLFTRLQEVDLRGCSALTLNGAHQLLVDGLNSASFRRISWPEQISTILAERALFYRDLKLAKAELILDPKDISLPFLDEPQLRRQLKWHKQVYSDIYLNLNADALRSKLISILRLRKREQVLHDLSTGLVQ